jgi:hypothetical protein
MKFETEEEYTINNVSDLLLQFNKQKEERIWKIY